VLRIRFARNVRRRTQLVVDDLVMFDFWRAFACCNDLEGAEDDA
jgi:hypothetical protein